MKKRDQLQTQVTILEDTGTDPDQLQQQVRHLQDAAKERDRLQEHLVNIAEERDSLQDRAVELERLFQAASGPNEGMQTRDLGPETEVDEDPKQPSQPEARKKLRYCSVCLKSVDKLSANVRLCTYHFEVSANLCYRPKLRMQTNARPACPNFYS